MGRKRVPDLGAIKKRIESLKPNERLELFHFISDLPDSGIQTGNLVEPPFDVPLPEEKLKNSETTDEFVMVFTPPNIDPSGVAVVFKGKTILQVFFHPNNYHQGRLKMKRSWQYAEPTAAMMDRIRSVIAKAGGQITDQQIREASTDSMKQIFETMSIRMTNEMAQRLPDMVVLLMTAAEKIIEISVLNGFSESTGQFDKVRKLDQIVKELEPFWQRIKETHLQVTQGGARNIKHLWTVEEEVCLKTNYDQLKPIWIQAKKIATEALRSNESKRQREWRSAVLGTYPDLPIDLLNRFEYLRSDDAKPSDIALEHAARKCIPIKLSNRRLRNVIKKFTFKPA